MHLLLHSSPNLFLKNPGDEDGFPAKGSLMTILRQGRVVLPLWDHEKNVILWGVPTSLADIRNWVQDAG